MKFIGIKKRVLQQRTMINCFLNSIFSNYSMYNQTNNCILAIQIPK
jgi:hypothetical protein